MKRSEDATGRKGEKSLVSKFNFGLGVRAFLKFLMKRRKRERNLESRCRRVCASSCVSVYTYTIEAQLELSGSRGGGGEWSKTRGEHFSVTVIMLVRQLFSI